MNSENIRHEEADIPVEEDLNAAPADLKNLVLNKLTKPPRQIPFSLQLQLIMNKSFFYFLLSLAILIIFENIIIFTDIIEMPFNKLYAVVIAAPIGIGIMAPLLFMLAMGFESVRLLRSGKVIKSKVVEVEENPDEPGTGRLAFRFRDKNGKSIEGYYNTRIISEFPNGGEKYLLHNPDNPQRFWPLDDFPEEIDITGEGEWVSPKSSSMIYPVLSVFVLVIIFAQTIQLYRAFAWVFR